MAGVMKIIGMAGVLKNLSRSHEKIGKALEAGLITGASFLLRESKLVCPVDTSNLKNGGRVRNIGGKGFKADLVVEYLADYAVMVHENLSARHKEGKQAKYLEYPARLHRNEIIKIVQKTARTKIRTI